MSDSTAIVSGGDNNSSKRNTVKDEEASLRQRALALDSTIKRLRSFIVSVPALMKLRRSENGNVNKGGMQSVEENIPKSIPITLLGQCQETNLFKSNFASWSSASTAPVPEETRGKVAALLKQQQGLIKGQAKTPPVEEEVPPLLAKNGKFEMWRIDGEEKTPLPKEDIGKFY
ncbi:hypothetical protein L2E82_16860 [Cichorium intybus]|uniref:Uncharacterized protein n=1 Tax=Cichorium intybus TaxID=13427 RepID=A0ACB9F7N1_CICIN|nr:hypothetical protein L2E82_16860 [Cichorium intybus]